jgi:hypothetical protein
MIPGLLTLRIDIEAIEFLQRKLHPIQNFSGCQVLPMGSRAQTRNSRGLSKKRHSGFKTKEGSVLSKSNLKASDSIILIETRKVETQEYEYD